MNLPLHNSDDPLIFDKAHSHETHERWARSLNRRWPKEDEEFSEEAMDILTNEQCGQCRYYILLKGPLSTGWGACSNKDSRFDRTVMFEHDGCDHYSEANEWVGNYKQVVDEP